MAASLNSHRMRTIEMLDQGPRKGAVWILWNRIRMIALVPPTTFFSEERQRSSRVVKNTGIHRVGGGGSTQVLRHFTSRLEVCQLLYLL